MGREIAKAYEPAAIEPRWAEYWVKEQLFRADPNAETGGKVFSMVIPPPNVTGSLHIGHMLNHTEIDILVRWHRMRGYNTLYLPGTDHAGISTQRVVVKQLVDQGIDYRTLGREEFERRVWKWKEQSGGRITEQMRAIGESCDWTREKFTLSPELSRVVRKVFVQLYNEKLIYRDTRLVNWCPECQTVLSDLEVIHEERRGSLWYIRYPVAGSSETVVVATTRPETMLGDTAVAVNPEDERYRGLIGRTLILPLLGRQIPVVADAMVDREFGTGAVKITPAHDPNDFEVGRRHKLPEIDVMTGEGKMNEAAGPYAGLDRFEARKKVVEDLKTHELLDKVTEHTSAIGLCERSKTIVEPRIMTQWFGKMKPLAEPAIEAVERGEIQIVPENRRQEYFNWMRNIRDWTLSRQLWWGHRIPAWYCGDCGEIVVAEEEPTACTKCGSKKLMQDPDVLDTWFSSALWPFSTLGWPEQTADFKTYYPTSLLITGYDILFFWVARMIMQGIHFTGKVPFRAVYLHSLVRTGSGEKMSKSKGTGLDPVLLNQKYGTDAMRFCLASMAAPGTDIVLSDDRLTSARNFANKIWNAARFLFLSLAKIEGGDTSLGSVASPQMRAAAPLSGPGDLPLVDRWIYSKLAKTVSSIETSLSAYRFHEAANSAYQFFWGDFCDWYVEWVKPDLLDEGSTNLKISWINIFGAFDSALKLLHPFMPFLTEELWHQLPNRPEDKSIALQQFPTFRGEWVDEEAEAEFSQIQEILGSIRYIRAELKLDPKRKVAADCRVRNPLARDLIHANKKSIERLSSLSDLRLTSNELDPKRGVVRSTALFDVQIAFGEGIDKSAEIARLKKDIEKLSKNIESKQLRLGDPDFKSKAPQKVIEDMVVSMGEQQTQNEKLKEQLAELQRE